MRKLLKKTTTSLMLSLTLVSQMAFPESPTLDIPALQCLSRPQKETIANCFDENDQCHIALASAAADKRQPWETYILLSLAGFAAGLVTASQLKR